MIQSSSFQTDKDLIIVQLKSRIFELEQNEKNYEKLNSSLSSLKNELSKIKDDSIRKEKETRTKEEIQNKQIKDLTLQNENLQSLLNERITANRKLYADNEALLNISNSLKMEMTTLNQKINNTLSQSEQLKCENEKLQRNHNELTQNLNAQREQNEKLFEDNRKLNRICKEKEMIISQNENDKVQLVSKFEEINYEVSNLKGKISSKEENLSFLQNQCDQLKKINQEYEFKIMQLEKINQSLKSEKESINVNLNDERVKNGEFKNSLEQAGNYIKEMEMNLNKYIEEFNKESKENRQLLEEKSILIKEKQMMSDEISQLKVTIKNLIDHIKGVISSDEKIGTLVDRKEKIYGLLKRNKMNIERSLSSFNDKDYISYNPDDRNNISGEGIVRNSRLGSQ